MRHSKLLVISGFFISFLNQSFATVAIENANPLFAFEIGLGTRMIEIQPYSFGSSGYSTKGFAISGEPIKSIQRILPIAIGMMGWTLFQLNF